MRLWNTMNREARGRTPLIFDVEELKSATATSSQYSLDVAGAEGPAIPEIRQAMEAFFGPGGKMQLWLVPVDDEHVIFASAHDEEVTAALEVARSQATDRLGRCRARGRQQTPAREIPIGDSSSIRTVIQSHGRSDSDAMTGPVFGGRPQKGIPAIAADRVRRRTARQRNHDRAPSSPSKPSKAPASI